TRYKQGWGRPSLRHLYDWRDHFFIVDESDVIQPLETKEYQVQVDAGEPSFRATMVYLDPAGNPSIQTQHRINDLSLEVIAPDGSRYAGNNGLKQGIWSVASPTAPLDTKNVEENVFVQNPIAGTWTVHVIASEIVQDSHVETPEMDADFALVVSGVA